MLRCSISGIVPKRLSMRSMELYVWWRVVAGGSDTSMMTTPLSSLGINPEGVVLSRKKKHAIEIATIPKDMAGFLMKKRTPFL